jgi:hypothetical protein
VVKIVISMALLCLTCPNLVPGQVVRTGPQDPDYCYKIETIVPNLRLIKAAHVKGSIVDKVNAPLKNSRVELRRYISQREQAPIKTVTTDDAGGFDLGTIRAGKYRLLASPTRAFNQPSDLKCNDGSQCDLKIVLQIKDTDQPDSICPIR